MSAADELVLVLPHDCYTRYFEIGLSFSKHLGRSTGRGCESFSPPFRITGSWPKKTVPTEAHAEALFGGFTTAQQRSVEASREPFLRAEAVVSLVPSWQDGRVAQLQ